MATLQIYLDDELAGKADEFGLLKPDIIAGLIADEVKRRSWDGLLSVADKLAAAGDVPMTAEEVQEEIRAYRKTRYAASA